MKVYKKAVYIVMFSAILALSLNCREEVPIGEMSEAKLAITRAQSVKADKYAPDEMKAATEKLVASHAFIRDEETGDAAGAAVASKEKAVEAYNKAVPLLAKDSIAAAENDMQNATNVYAEVLAKSSYSEAKNSLQEANQLFENKQYYSAHVKAEDAGRKARAAREASLGRKSILRDSIEDVNVTIAKAKQYNAEQHAPGKLRLAEENAQLAGNSLNSLKLKEGFAAVEIAKVNADDAYIMSLKGTSRVTIDEARTLVAQAEGSPGAKVAATDLAMAKESLKSSESLLLESKYRESISAAEDSKRLAQTVIAASSSASVSAAGAGSSVTEGEAGYRTYTVKYRPANRDTLWGIAKKFYNNGFQWKKIYNANQSIINNPNLIRPGWKLKVPVEEKAKKAETKEEAAQ
ncbi:MAG TPA: LysM peptidoglycan-binding domain-containing protein [Spirochaetota bacterium]|nr:LysM peptidoglycan-binding domain-containing protein [Spirochaetota bacterium]